MPAFIRENEDQPIVAHLELRPLWRHKQGLTFTASGYGAAIPTPYVAVCYDKRLRRVYCTRYANAGTCWIKVNGGRLIVESAGFNLIFSV